MGLGSERIGPKHRGGTARALAVAKRRGRMRAKIALARKLAIAAAPLILLTNTNLPAHPAQSSFATQCETSHLQLSRNRGADGR